MTTESTKEGELRPPAKAVSTLGRRNRQLAGALGCVAAAVFVAVLCLAVMFHYAEVHHLVAAL